MTHSIPQIIITIFVFLFANYYYGLQGVDSTVKRILDEVHLHVVQDELAKARYKSSEAAQFRAHQSVAEVHDKNLFCII